MPLCQLLSLLLHLLAMGKGQSLHLFLLLLLLQEQHSLFLGDSSPLGLLMLTNRLKGLLSQLFPQTIESNLDLSLGVGFVFGQLAPFMSQIIFDRTIDGIPRFHAELVLKAAVAFQCLSFQACFIVDHFMRLYDNRHGETSQHKVLVGGLADTVLHTVLLCKLHQTTALGLAPGVTKHDRAGDGAKRSKGFSQEFIRYSCMQIANLDGGVGGSSADADLPALKHSAIEGLLGLARGFPSGEVHKAIAAGGLQVHLLDHTVLGEEIANVFLFGIFRNAPNK